MGNGSRLPWCVPDIYGLYTAACRPHLTGPIPWFTVQCVMVTRVYVLYDQYVSYIPTRFPRLNCLQVQGSVISVIRLRRC